MSEDDGNNNPQEENKSNTWMYVCCGLIILIALAAFFTGGNSNKANETLSDKVNASGENMTFFGMSTPVGSDGYQFATFDADHNIYYMSFDMGCKVGRADPSTMAICNWDLETTSKEGYQYSGTTVGSAGINHILSYQPRDHEKVQFQYPREGNFSFTYVNKTVMGNENARVITHVYYPNGTEIEK